MEKKVIELAEKIEFISSKIPGQGPTPVIVEKITIRPLTEEETIRMLDKASIAETLIRQNNKSVDLLDDGDEEMIKAIESPPTEVVRDLLEKRPLLLQKLLPFFKEMGGGNIKIEEQKEPESNPELIQKYENGLITFLVDGKTIKVQKLSRMSTKIVLKDMALHQTVLNKTAVDQLKLHIIDECKEEALTLFRQKPFCCIRMALMLLDHTNIELKEIEKKA